ncbi:MAG: DUF523 and DUF1722 domain-containing protein [Thermoguttaceae bacterium]|nr:DUF523 and DUF1722 domain-containing protein [Thermoguttaceae bacterium]
MNSNPNQSIKIAESDGMKPVRVGVSACLLGTAVRFNGGHQRSNYIAESLSHFVQYVPVCPEVEIGLGTPREAIRLRRSHAGGPLQLVGSRTGTDHTEAMQQYSSRKLDQLDTLNLSGYIFAKNSPTCGVHRVRVYDQNGVPSRDGRGLFAAAVVERWPLLPVEEDGRLNDPQIRESFLHRIFAYHRAKSLFASSWSVGDLVRFHTREKMLLLAHDPATFRRLGALVAGAKERPRDEIAAEYLSGFMGGLSRVATAGSHFNVLEHVLGFFKRLLGPDEKRELLQLMDDFRRRFVPLAVPLTLIRHYVTLFQIAYLRDQTYLASHPRELMLQVHV